MALFKSLKLCNFRNYQRVEVLFGNQINSIEGNNGHGKTNLLEALFLLSVGRSFRTHHMKELIRQGSDHFSVEALFESEGIEQTLKIHFADGEKKIFHNDTPCNALLGLIPHTIHSPLDIEMIIGAPSIRRRFMNLHIAQVNPRYAFHLTRYAKALAHRNALLKAKKLDTLEIWEAEMETSALFLVDARRTLLSELSSRMTPYYKRLVPQDEELELQYHPSLSEGFREHWKKSRPREMEMKTTLYGPHRDDFTILRSNQNAKTYASEGQKRSLLAALKLAEFSLLKERSQTTPIMSIDDFGIHLDENRNHLFRKELAHMGQVFVTTPTALDVSGHHIRLSHGALLECQHVS